MLENNAAEVRTDSVIELKKKLFDKYYNNLNDCQRKAVYTVNGPLLVLAGAGSGKTTVLVNRIAHIIKFGCAYESERIPVGITQNEIDKINSLLCDEECDKDELEALLSSFAEDACPPWAIMAITFTNKAANEIKSRLEAKLGESAGDIWAGTFHSICMRLLRKFCERIGYANGFTIYDTEDSKRLITSCMKQLEIDDKILPQRSIMNIISRAKDKLQTPEDFIAETGNDPRFVQIAKVYKLYQSSLVTNNALDFDDIIMQTVRLLKENEDARTYCQNRFKYVCVDEYQDTNHAQFVLTKLLSGHYNNLMVVGDDDQSIYKFRGATIENIMRFDEYFENANIIKLEQNYRSTQNILSAANAVIANNQGRRGKELWTSNGDGEKLYLKKLDNQIDEAKFIINKIMELVIREKRSYSDFAVLYRINAQSNSLEQIFAKSGVPYRVLGGMRFYERKEIKDILAYLCVVNNHADNLRLRRIINEPKRKIGEATVSAVEQLAEINHTSMFEIMERANEFTAISKAAPKLKEFTLLIKGLHQIAESEQLPVLIEKTIDLTGYRNMLLHEGEEALDRLSNIQELVSNAVEYVNNAEEPTLTGFLEEVALISDIDNYDESADAVVLMTVHSAKGLEFPVIFLPGLEDGIFPGMQAVMNPEELEEERRLAYVAITRAKERLFASHVRERLIYGRTQFNHLSRFVEEIPPEFMEIDDPRKNRPDPPREKRPKHVISKEFTKPSDLAANVGKSTTFEHFSAGSRVSHMMFGKGTVLSATNMGSDVLYEIAFDEKGTKKLMATYAKLKKCEE